MRWRDFIHLVLGAMQRRGFARVFGQRGYFYAYQTPKKSTLTKLINTNLTELQDIGIDGLEFTTPQQVNVSGVQGAATLNYRGLLATQQGGSIPVEGFAYYFVRSNGYGVTAFGLCAQGCLKPKTKLVNGYNTMLSTLVSTL